MQTKTHSFIEQLFNIGSGFIISCLLWAYVIRPAIHAQHISVDDTLIITGLFTIVSIIRGYIWRRLFNHHTKKQVEASEDKVLLEYGLPTVAEARRIKEERKQRVLSIDFSSDIEREQNVGV